MHKLSPPKEGEREGFEKVSLKCRELTRIPNLWETKK